VGEVEEVILGGAEADESVDGDDDPDGQEEGQEQAKLE
jgi:hypothetical protein